MAGNEVAEINECNVEGYFDLGEVEVYQFGEEVVVLHDEEKVFLKTSIDVPARLQAVFYEHSPLSKTLREAVSEVTLVAFLCSLCSCTLEPITSDYSYSFRKYSATVDIARYVLAHRKQVCSIKELATFACVTEYAMQQAASSSHGIIEHIVNGRFKVYTLGR